MSIRVLSCFLAISATLLTANNTHADDEGTAVENESQQRQAFLAEQAREHVLSAVDNSKTYELSASSVINYSNPTRERGSTDGCTFVWLDGKRPVAICSFSIRRPDDLYFEMTSFNKSALACRHDGSVMWAPQSWEAPPEPFAATLPPASREAQRLVQMRGLARGFNAVCTHQRTNDHTQLRLLPQPIYRYQDPAAGIIDGAIFAFVVSNDPELLLRIEAVAADDGPAIWEYSFGRMSSHQIDVKLKDESIWNVPNYYESGRTTTGPYIEGGLGKYVDSKRDGG